MEVKYHSPRVVVKRSYASIYPSGRRSQTLVRSLWFGCHANGFPCWL